MRLYFRVGVQKKQRQNSVTYPVSLIKDTDLTLLWGIKLSSMAPEMVILRPAYGLPTWLRTGVILRIRRGT